MSSLSANLIRLTLVHLEKGIPIDRLGLKESQKQRLVRVKMVYEQFERNPHIEALELFKDLSRGKVRDDNLAAVAKRDMVLFNFILQQMAAPNRKISEYRVRSAANRLIRMGIETDNGRDIEAGSKLLIKVDRLDQPESEQIDLAKSVLLPPVLVTRASEIGQNREEVDDNEVKRIMQKYGAVEDDKLKAIDDRVALMIARSSTQEEDDVTCQE